MDTAIGLAVSLLIPTLAGSAILALLFPRDQSLPLPLHIALAYGLGLGTLTIWMLLLGMAGLKFSLWSIGLPLLAFSCAVFVIQRSRWTKNRKLSGKSFFQNTSWFPFTILNVVTSTALLLYIVHNLLFVFWLN